MKEDKKRGRKWLLLLLLFIFLVFYFLFRSYLPKPDSNKNILTKSTEAKPLIVVNNPTEPQKTIKCQTVVVSPKVTTELFTYVSGEKIRVDYRVGATSEEESFKTQIYYDGSQVYLWKPPINYGDTKPENPKGIRMKMPEFKYSINLTKLGEIERFGSSPLSGDHLCSEWDGVDAVFEVPSDFEFNETDITQKITEELGRICQTCEGASTVELKSTCRKNLGCE